MTPSLELSIAHRQGGGLLINCGLCHVRWPELEGTFCKYLKVRSKCFKIRYTITERVTRKLPKRCAQKEMYIYRIVT